MNFLMFPSLSGPMAIASDPLFLVPLPRVLSDKTPGFGGSVGEAAARGTHRRVGCAALGSGSPTTMLFSLPCPFELLPTASFPAQRGLPVPGCLKLPWNLPRRVPVTSGPRL